MYLQKLEIIGFKSFAEKTELDFLPPSANSKGITAVVGPNGSGKSNVADALRWVLGEQSTKLLRGKKAEDVIFFGSEKRARSGFAEVSLVLNNEDGKIPLDLSEVSIARRVYRDGESEYLINKNKVRLADIQMLLAQAQFSARSYSVIGQGMADAILTATPLARKEYLDEAAGVRQFQLKRQNSVAKLEATRENLNQADMLVNEIEPRLRSLARQVKRLETRAAIEEELHAIAHQYYGRQWLELKSQIDSRQATVGRLDEEWKKRESTLEDAQSELSGLEAQEQGSDEFTALQTEYEKLAEERNRLRDRQVGLRGKLEVAEQVRKQTATTLPLSKIISEVKTIGAEQNKAITELKNATDLAAAQATVPAFESLQTATISLGDRLERPVPEIKPVEQDPALLREIEEIGRTIAAIDEKIRQVQNALQEYNRGERQKKEKFFSLQRGLQEKISSALALERQLNDERIELARLDTRREALEQEMSVKLGERAEHVKTSFIQTGTESADELFAQMQKLEYQLNLIGGIDPEVVREYQETNTRHEFLTAQIADLRKAIEDLERVISELDIVIKTRWETSFRQINKDFDRFFKQLFNGGKAELVQMWSEQEEAEEDEPTAAAAGSETGEQEALKKKEPSAQTLPAYEQGERIVGIDIHACPPGKKIKNVETLSGGERTLVSIALICAIMVSNPSPFVVLDEVDAALDEANSDKYASILAELAEKTQFIVVTHNRYTMKRANVLYGVTMRDDKTSLLLSVNLDEVSELQNQNRQKAVA
ncbi:MAG: AAA family ATPase [Patescibacteria group bacterium]|jgi:chromosome segregation protein